MATQVTSPLLSTAVLLLAASAFAAAPPRGYVSRGCGFDLNFNGVQGEPADCANICRGGASNVDIDGNGVADRTVYVDCTAGTNSTTCGSAGSPCRTLQWAMDGSNSSFTDRMRAPGTNQIQAICFRGTCGNAVLRITQSGAVGNYSRTQAGSEARAFQYPRYPFIVSGWDSDGDGLFPPHDVNDTSVMKGNVSGNTDTAISPSDRDRLEFAHFRIDDYGRACNNNEIIGSSAGSHHYWHDLALARSHRACDAGGQSGMIVFPQWASNGVKWFWSAYENIQLTETGAYGWRGGPGISGPDAGPIRIKNISWTSFGNSASRSGAFPIKIWDYVTGIEVLDSVFDQDPDAWNAGDGGVGNVAISPEICSRDWTIRNNELIDFKKSIMIQPWAGSGYCSGRSVDGIVIDANSIHNAYAEYQYGDTGLIVEDGAASPPSANNSVGNLTITNNFFSTSVSWEACMRLQIGYSGSCSDHPGVVQVVNNNCHGVINRHAAIVIGWAEEPNRSCPQRHYRFYNNVISGLASGDGAVWTTYAVSDWRANNNVYAVGSEFSWNDPPYTRDQGLSLSQWRASSGGDSSGKTCNPTYVASNLFNLRLQSSDSCARDAGTDGSLYTRTDIDFLARPAGVAWDVGGHEVGALSDTPTAPVLLDVTPIAN